jgi:hypothetical protein
VRKTHQVKIERGQYPLVVEQDGEVTISDDISGWLDEWDSLPYRLETDEDIYRLFNWKPGKAVRMAVVAQVLGADLGYDLGKYFSARSLAAGIRVQIEERLAVLMEL